MKSEFFTNIIIEGCDGVGKTTLHDNLLKHYDYNICVYDRGEFSNFVYAKKYNRLFSAMQRNLPFLYILLYCDKKELAKRIIKRGREKNWSDSDIENELDKINDQDLFLKYKNEFRKDYHLIELDVTHLDEQQTTKKVVKLIEEYNSKLNKDDENNYSKWNQLYAEGCKQLGLNFKVINNQPFINNFPIMGEANLHNGLYETFVDRRCPHNLIYCLAYNQTPEVIPFEKRTEDFTYIINSKILTRHEVYDYIDKFVENNLTCDVGKEQYFSKNPYIKTYVKSFGDEYIKKLTNAKASVYIARRLAYLKYTSVRLYENILAQNIIFVDKLSDLDCDILKQIHNKNDKIINLLYVDENTICENYKKVINNKKLVKTIIKNQNNWYKKVKEELFENVKKGKLKV